MRNEAIVFDFDGVLVDSAPLIKQSYCAAGVSPPHNILAYEGVPWIERQVGSDNVDQVRRIKNINYLDGLLDVAVLAPYFASITLSSAYNVGILSGAPPGSLRVFKSRLNIWPFSFALDGLRTPAKMDLLNTMRFGTIGVYVDDQPYAVDLPYCWTFIQYVGQDKNELCKEIVDALVRGRNLANCR